MNTKNFYVLHGKSYWLNHKFKMEEIKMKRNNVPYFVLLVQLMFFYNVYAQTKLLVSDNFDDGSADGWDLQFAEISREQAHSGGYSVKVTHNGTAILRKTISMTTMAGYDTVTVQYWWFTASSWTTGTGVKFCRLRTPGQELQTELWWSENLGSEPLELGGYQYGPYSQSQSFNRGSWMKIKIFYVYNTIGQSNGILRIWFNDVLKYNYSNIGWRNTTTYTYNQFSLPSNIGTSNANCINYVDDVEIWGGEAASHEDPNPKQVVGIKISK
jgi:hypothetical protein